MADEQPTSDASATVPMPVAIVLPPITQPRTVFDYFVRGWRPFCGWMVGLFLARAAFVPIWQTLHKLTPEEPNWLGMTSLATALIAARSFDKSKGTAN